MLLIIILGTIMSSTNSQFQAVQFEGQATVQDIQLFFSVCSGYPIVLLHLLSSTMPTQYDLQDVMTYTAATQ
jgi:hypothetical protein